MNMTDVGKATRVLSSVVAVTVIAYGIYLLTAKEAPGIDEQPLSSLEQPVSSSSESTITSSSQLID